MAKKTTTGKKKTVKQVKATTPSLISSDEVTIGHFYTALLDLNFQLASLHASVETLNAGVSQLIQQTSKK